MSPLDVPSPRAVSPSNDGSMAVLGQMLGSLTDGLPVSFALLDARGRCLAVTGDVLGPAWCVGCDAIECAAGLPALATALRAGLAGEAQTFAVIDGARRLEGRVTPANGRVGVVVSETAVAGATPEDENARFHASVLRAQAEASIDAIIVVDTQRRVVSYNQRFKDMWHITDELADRVADTAVFAPLAAMFAHPERSQQRLEALYADPLITRHDELELRDGRVLDRYSAPMTDEAGVVLGRLWLFRDVTERVQAKRALVERERFLHAVVDALPCPLFVLRDGVITLSNSANDARNGAAPGTLVGQRPERLLSDAATSARLVAENEDIVRTGMPVFQPARAMPRPDGTVEWLQIRKVAVTLPDGVVGVLGILEDITPLREAVQAQQRSEQRFRSLIEHAPLAVSMFREGIFTYTNPATAQMLGCTPASLIGRSFADVTHPDDLAKARERAQKMITTGISEPMTLYRFVRDDGAMVVAETTTLAVEFDGAPCLLMFAHDVTERVDMEARLRQADRMISIGTLAAGVAHEINNPLASVIGNLTVAREYLPEIAHYFSAHDDPLGVAAVGEVIQTLDEVGEGVERVRIIVRDLKTLSRSGDEEARTRVDVQAAVESAIQVAGNAIRGRARVVRDYGGDRNARVFGDASRLGQLFLNLLTNASQAIPEGDVEGNEIRVAIAMGETTVVVEIVDSGSGIPAEILGRVFDPFFTTRAPGEGTGLGLSICHGIVDALGGVITAGAAPGRGTVLRVELPLDTRTEELPRTIVTSLPPAASHDATGPLRRRILVVDDEAAIGRALCRLLARDGHEIVTVDNGRDALALLLEESRTFDVVMCDLMMPGQTGPELYASVHAVRPEIAQRFVFMSGGAFTARSQQFLESVPNPLIEKPFDPARIRALLAAR